MMVVTCADAPAINMIENYTPFVINAFDRYLLVLVMGHFLVAFFNKSYYLLSQKLLKNRI